MDGCGSLPDPLSSSIFHAQHNVYAGKVGRERESLGMRLQNSIKINIPVMSHLTSKKLLHIMVNWGVSFVAQFFKDFPRCLLHGLQMIPQ